MKESFCLLDSVPDCREREHYRTEEHTFAQTQPPSRPQQVAGTAATGADIVMVVCVFVLVLESKKDVERSLMFFFPDS